MLVYNKEGAGLGSETPSANQGILQEFLQQATQGAGAGHLPENVQGAGAAATVAGAAVGAPNPALFEAAEERALAWALSDAVDRCGPLLEEEDFAGVMGVIIGGLVLVKKMEEPKAARLEEFVLDLIRNSPLRSWLRE